MQFVNLYIDKNGQVKYCGKGSVLKIRGIDESIIIPKAIQGLTNVKQIFSDNESFFFLMEDDTLKACGDNNYGQLGIGVTGSLNKIVDVPVSDVNSVSCYNGVTFILLNDGTLLGCGRGDQPGRFTTVSAQNPNLTVIFKNVRQCIHSSTYTFVIFNDNTIKICGNRDAVIQLGLKDMPYELIATMESRFIKVPIDFDAENLVDLNSNGTNSCFLYRNGDLVVCGPDYGNYGDRFNRNNIIAKNIKSIMTDFRDVGGIGKFLFLDNKNILYGLGNNQGSFHCMSPLNGPFSTPVQIFTDVKQTLGNNMSTFILLTSGKTVAIGYCMENELGLSASSVNNSVFLYDRYYFTQVTDAVQLMDNDLSSKCKMLLKKKSSNELFYINLNNLISINTSDLSKLDFSNSIRTGRDITRKYTNANHKLTSIMENINEPFKLYMTREEV